MKLNINRFLSPETTGNVSPELESIIYDIHKNTNGDYDYDLIVIDYRETKSVSLLAGLDLTPRNLADDVFVFNPLDFDRPCGFYGKIDWDKPTSPYKFLTFTYFLEYFGFNEISKVIKEYDCGEPINSFRNVFNFLYFYDDKTFKSFENKFKNQIGKKSYEKSTEFFEKIRFSTNGKIIKSLLAIPFFCDAFVFNSLNEWTSKLVFCNLDCSKLPLMTAKWMTQCCIRSKVYAITDQYLSKIRNQSTCLNLFIIDDDMDFTNIDSLKKLIDNNMITKAISELNVYLQSTENERVLKKDINNEVKKDKEVAEALVQLSRLKFGRSIKFVEKEALAEAPETLNSHIECNIKQTREIILNPFIENCLCVKGKQWTLI